jgi:hypothetical protein
LSDADICGGWCHLHAENTYQSSSPSEIGIRASNGDTQPEVPRREQLIVEAPQPSPECSSAWYKFDPSTGESTFWAMVATCIVPTGGEATRTPAVSSQDAVGPPVAPVPPPAPVVRAEEPDAIAGASAPPAARLNEPPGGVSGSRAPSPEIREPVPPIDRPNGNGESANGAEAPRKLRPKAKTKKGRPKQILRSNDRDTRVPAIPNPEPVGPAVPEPPVPAERPGPWRDPPRVLVWPGAPYEYPVSETAAPARLKELPWYKRIPGQLLKRIEDPEKTLRQDRSRVNAGMNMPKRL